MLKNKKEREAFLLNESNWLQIEITCLDLLHYNFKKLILPDGTIVIREDVYEKDEFLLSLVENI